LIEGDQNFKRTTIQLNNWVALGKHAFHCDISHEPYALVLDTTEFRHINDQALMGD
jgi:hypothetical protein